MNLLSKNKMKNENSGNFNDCVHLLMEFYSRMDSLFAIAKNPSTFAQVFDVPSIRALALPMSCNKLK